ncbi:MAG: DUF2062 domain-containing protein [Tannerellaceae bacterium]|jgi:glycosyltransferase involved in cell wall biosynthesis|nr:DUF2062 domain-containing protein [Tannerellaceae bacterium]
MTTETRHTAVVIPTYNNAGTLGNVLEDVLSYGLPVIVVNDGSTDRTAEVLEEFPEVRVVSYPENRGKGFALRTGLAAAAEGERFRYAITLDSDGQHFAGDIPSFLQAVAQHPDSLLIGARNLSADNMPGGNRFANRFSNFWFTLETGLHLGDTQSGFRLYPLRKLAGIRFFTAGYEFELEVIVRAAWRGVRVANIPVNVYYPPEGERVSHFSPLRDFTRISVLNMLFVLVAFGWYWPCKCLKSLTRQHIKRFISDHVTHSKESNGRIAGAVALGVFMGIVPVWGYQMIAAGVLAHLLGLNKVIAIVSSNISIPPVIPFILFGSYAAGGWLLGRPVLLAMDGITFETVKDSLTQYLAGSILFALACALLAGLACFTLLSLFRKPESSVQ